LKNESLFKSAEGVSASIVLNFDDWVDFPEQILRSPSVTGKQAQYGLDATTACMAFGRLGSLRDCYGLLEVQGT
jgi:hypothetical protein